MAFRQLLVTDLHSILGTINIGQNGVYWEKATKNIMFTAEKKHFKAKK